MNVCVSSFLLSSANWTVAEVNILSPSAETFGNNAPIDENMETTNEGKTLL